MTKPHANGDAALRSRQWFGTDDLQGMSHPAYLRAEGFTRGLSLAGFG